MKCIQCMFFFVAVKHFKEMKLMMKWANNKWISSCPLTLVKALAPHMVPQIQPGVTFEDSQEWALSTARLWPPRNIERQHLKNLEGLEWRHSRKGACLACTQPTWDWFPGIPCGSLSPVRVISECRFRSVIPKKNQAKSFRLVQSGPCPTSEHELYVVCENTTNLYRTKSV